LYRLARDRAFRVIRSAKPRAADIDAMDVADEPDAEEFTVQDAARVHDALDKLAPEHRDVLLLRYVESMTYSQIAAITQCELGTVRSRLHYGKRALREIIERDDHEQRIRITAG
jgi:RNA polymerase sigma-70 factor (ECF subfamily)